MNSTTCLFQSSSLIFSRVILLAGLLLGSAVAFANPTSTTVSITQSDANPTSADSVHFNVDFTNDMSGSFPPAAGITALATGGLVRTPDAWTAGVDLPGARNAFFCAELDGKIYVAGGNADNISSLIVYDPQRGAWESRAPMPTPRFCSGQAGAAVNGRFYVIGGHNGANVVNTNECYDPATNTWQARTPMPTPRNYCGSAVVDGKIYVMGGYNDGFSVTYNTVEVYDPAADSWQSCAPMPTPTGDFACIALNGRIYAIGGIYYHVAFLSTLQEYDPKTNSWRQLTSYPRTLYSLRGAALNGRLVVVGGSDRGAPATNEVWEYNPEDNQWRWVIPMAYGRGYLQCVALGHCIYAIGGVSGSGPEYASVEVYHPANSFLDGTTTVTGSGLHYTVTLTPRLPLANGTLSIDLGRGLLDSDGQAVLGQTTSSIYRIQNQPTTVTITLPDPNPTAADSVRFDVDFTNDMTTRFLPTGGISAVATGALRRTTDAWTAGTDIPQVRSGAFYGEIGGKIYVVGGSDSTTNYEYDPVAAVWSSRAPLPAPRWTGGQSTAVVDGKLYVIGGVEGSTTVNTNYAYDPSSNQWKTNRPMPTARHYAGVVPVDGKIYVMGGYNNNGQIFSTVEEYDPATDSWRTRASLPGIRGDFACSVVGGRIYVIGGTNWAANCAEVFEYDPKTNVWRQRTSIPRNYYGLRSAAVGGRIYVTGGSSYPAPTSKETWEYDPAADSWRAVAPMTEGRTYQGCLSLNDRIYVLGGNLWDGATSGVSKTVEVYQPVNSFDGTTSVTGSGAHYAVTLTPRRPLANGTLAIDLGRGLLDPGNNLVKGATTSSAYLIQNTPTSVTITRTDPSPTDADAVHYSVDFSRDVSVSFPPAAGIIALATGGLARKGNTWSAGTDMPAARNGFFYSEIGGKFYVAGGADYSGSLNSCLVYDPLKKQWASIAPMPSPKNNGQTTGAVVNGKFYAIGGTNGSSAQKTNYCYDPAADRWETRQAMPTARLYSGMAAVGGKIYVIGGSNNTNPDVVYNVVEEYDPVTDSWRARAPMPTTRCNLACVAINGKIYVMGGATNWSAARAEVEEYDPIANTWRSLPAMPKALLGMSGVSYCDRIYLVGGAVPGYPASGETWEFNPATNGWRRLASLAQGRHYFGCLAFMDRIFAFGGDRWDGGSNQLFKSMEIYEPANTFFDGTTSVTGSGAHYTVTLTPRLPLANGTISIDLGRGLADPGDNPVLGQTTTTAYLIQNTPTSVTITRTDPSPTAADAVHYSVDFTNDVTGSFPPAGGIAALATGGLARKSGAWNTGPDLAIPHSGFFYGEIGGKFYLVGGNDSANGNIPGTTLIFDPQRGAWSTGASMPTPRATGGQCVAVAGGKLYAIGGTDGPSNVYSNNECYDPATNQWEIRKPLTPARGWAGMASVGGKVYVIGGYSSQLLNNVEEYDPATDSWRSRAPMPTARAQMACVVLGSHIYAIGGGTIAGWSSAPFSDVQEYDPQSNTWRTRAPLPQALWALHATALGGRIYVMGGHTQTTVSTREVWEYDPAADRWSVAASMAQPRSYIGCLAYNNRIYAIGGAYYDGQGNFSLYKSMEILDPAGSFLDGVTSVTGSGSHYTVTLTPRLPLANGTVSIDLGRGLSDPGDNPVLGQTTSTAYLIQNTPTTVTITLPDANPTSADTVHYNVDFSNDMTSSTFNPAQIGVLATGGLKRTSDAWAAGPAMTKGRNDFFCGQIGDKVYIVGGGDGTQITGANAIYDLSSGAWSNGASLAVPRCLGGQGGAVVDGKLYIFGGWNEATYNITECYDPVTNRWESRRAMPTPRGYVGVATVGGKIYVIGGVDYTIWNAHYNTVEEYDPATDLWRTCAPMPTARNNFACVALGGRIYAIGGAGSADTPHAEVEEFNPQTNSWRSLTPMSKPLYALRAAVLNNRIYVIGGGTATTPSTRETWEFDPSTGQWRPGAPLTAGRSSFGCFTDQGQIYLLGGVYWDGVSSHLYKNIEVYHPRGSFDGAMNVVNNNGKHFGVTLTPRLPLANGTLAITLPSGMLDPGENPVLGQTTSSAYVIQNAPTSVAITLPDPNPTSADTVHFKVDFTNDMTSSTFSPAQIGVVATGGLQRVHDAWTAGTDMPTMHWPPFCGELDGKLYVIGGYNGSSYVGVNEVYDTQTKTWSTRAPMPTSRSSGGQTAPVVNGKLYVIGGSEVSKIFNTNECYDPLTDHWESRRAMPTARGWNGSVAVGDKIYVIGGTDHLLGKLYDLVEEYDPATDTWRTCAPMPKACCDFACVVLNDRVYAIGGSDFNNAIFNNVQEYNPQTDSWQQRAPLPKAITGLSGAALNGRIYVMGGITNTPPSTREVWEYDPVADRWRAVSPMAVARQNVGCIAYNGNIYALGGTHWDGASRLYFKSMEIYSPSGGFDGAMTTTGSGAHYTVTLTPTRPLANGTLAITLPDGMLDPGGNPVLGPTTSAAYTLQHAYTSLYVDRVSGRNSGVAAGTAADPFKTITYALLAAKARGLADPLAIRLVRGTFDADTAKPAGERESFPIALREGMLLEGASAAICVIDAQHVTSSSSAILYGSGLAGVKIRNLTLRNMNRAGGTGQGGGAELAGCDATFENCTIQNCAAAQGGAICYTGNGSGLMSGNTFSGNTARSGGGGALWISGDYTGSLTSNRFQGNTAQAGGGFLVGGTLTGDVSANTFQDNRAAGPGGGFQVGQALLGNVEGNSFIGNQATGAGAGFIVGGGLPAAPASSVVGQIRVNTFAANASGDWGGGFALAARFWGSLSSNTFSGNSAVNSAGALGVSPAFVGDITDNVLSGNTAGTRGGAVLLELAATSNTTTLENNLFLSSELASGAHGAAVWTSAPVVCRHNLFLGGREGQDAFYLDPQAARTRFENNIFERTPSAVWMASNDDPDFTANLFSSVTDVFTRGGVSLGNDVGYIEILNYQHWLGNQDLDPLLVGEALASGTLTAAPAYDSASNTTLLTDATQGWVPGRFRMAMVNLTAGAGAPRHFPVLECTTSTLRVRGNLAGLASSGQAYRLDDYHLSPDSPAIDAGLGLGGTATDFEGDPRPSGPFVDPGPDEHLYFPGAPSVSFAAATSRATEGTTASVAVALSAPAPGLVTVRYLAYGGTAVPGGDYRLVPGELSFTTGSTSRAIPVPLASDAQLEFPETVLLALTSATGANLAVPTTHSLSIMDGNHEPGHIPQVAQMTLADPNPTGAAQVRFDIRFNEVVLGVDAGDFSLVAAGPVGAAITSVTGSQDAWQVTVSTGFGSGSLRLDLVDDDSIRDVAGNPLGGLGAGNGSMTGPAYTLDRSAPGVLSITRSGATPTSASAVSFTVTFSEAVSGVDAGDFSLAASGLTGAAVTGVSGSGSTWTVTAGTGSGSGSLRLDAIDNDSIVDGSGQPLGGPGAGNGGYNSGPAYTVDKDAPAVSSIVRADATPSKAASVRFTVTFSEAVSGVDAGDFSLVASGVAGAAVTGVSGSGATWTITVGTGSGSGSLRLDATDNDSIRDSAGNPLGGPGDGNGASSGPAYTIDKAPPAVSSIVRADASPTSLSAVRFTVTFSEAVSGVSAADFSLVAGGVSGASIGGVSGSGAVYTVTVLTGSGDGTLRLDVLDHDSIYDPANNPLGGPGSGNGAASGPAYAVDKASPAISAITRQGSTTTSGTTVRFSITFSEAVTGVEASDFTLVASGFTGAAITAVSGSGASYTVTAGTGSGNGTLRLDAADNDSIRDGAGNPLGGPGSGNGALTGPTYTVDKTPPAVTSIVRAEASPSRAASVRFTVTYSEAVSGVDAADFTLTASGVPGASISGVSGSGATWTVTVGTGSGSGTLRLDAADNDTVRDGAGNPLGGPGSGNGGLTGPAYTVDKTSPVVSGIALADANPTSASAVRFTVTFSEAVTGVNASDFALAASGVTGAAISAVSGSGAVYTVTAGTGSGSGTLKLNVADNDSIIDAAGNPLAGAFSTGPSYTVTKPIPASIVEQIVFDYKNSIWIMNADGSGATALTGGTAQDSCPRFNRDGSRIAFSSNRGGQYQIWTMRPDGSSLKAITSFQSGNPIHLAWAPDNRRLIAGTQGDTYWIVDSVTGAVSEFIRYSGKRVLYTDWSTKGQLAMAMEAVGVAFSTTIARVNDNGTSNSTILYQMFSTQPRWSRDGGALLFSTLETAMDSGGDNADLWRYDNQTRARTALTATDSDSEAGAVYSADGARIYFRRRPGTNTALSQICRIPAAGGAVTVIKSFSGAIGTLDAALVNLGSNEPPDQPTNLTPAAGASGVAVTPTLQASAFYDEDLNDTHRASQWQVRRLAEGYENALLDQRTSASVSFTLPAGVLSMGQTYAWHVRYFDSRGNASPWSQDTVFTTLTPPPPPDRVVILAGGGPYSGNAIAEQTSYLAGYAYRLSRNRQIPDAQIKFLSAFSSIDGNGDGQNDVDLPATRANLLNVALKTWPASCDKLIVYLVDHGSSDGTQTWFRVNETELVSASEVDAALDALQRARPTLQIALVSDFCYAGGFLTRCAATSGQKRLCVSGTTDESLAVFSGTIAGISFSNFFFDSLVGGNPFNSAFSVARDEILAVPTCDPPQVPWLDDNGDGFSTKNDGEMAKTFYWGNSAAFGATPPLIAAVTPDQTLERGKNSLKLYAELAPGHQITSVWANVIPVGSSYGAGGPVTDLPQVTLAREGTSQTWSATCKFTKPGVYRVTFFAKGHDGHPLEVMTSSPRVSRIKCISNAADQPWALYE